MQSDLNSLADAIISNNTWGVQSRLQQLGIIPMSNEGYYEQEWDAASLKTALCQAASMQPKHQYWGFVAKALDVPILTTGDTADMLAQQHLGGGALLRSQLYEMQGQQPIETDEPFSIAMPNFANGLQVKDLFLLAMAVSVLMLAFAGFIFIIKKI